MGRYELWQAVGPEAGAVSESFFCAEGGPPEAGKGRALLGPGDRLVWVVEAGSWEEAKRAREAQGFPFPTPEARAALAERNGDP